MLSCVLTYSSNELVKAAEGKQWLWKLPQEKFQSPSDDVNFLPLSILQVQVLLCRGDKDVTDPKEDHDNRENGSNKSNRQNGNNSENGNNRENRSNRENGSNSDSGTKREQQGD